jgi:hypothetical protein
MGRLVLMHTFHVRYLTVQFAYRPTDVLLAGPVCFVLLVRLCPLSPARFTQYIINIRDTSNDH